jgi:hypothetical protein
LLERRSTERASLGDVSSVLMDEGTIRVDTVLMIEVSWSSEPMDRRKAGIYAVAGVPVCWRLDLPRRHGRTRETPPLRCTRVLHTFFPRVPATATFGLLVQRRCGLSSLLAQRGEQCVVPAREGRACGFYGLKC